MSKRSSIVKRGARGDLCLDVNYLVHNIATADEISALRHASERIVAGSLVLRGLGQRSAPNGVNCQSGGHGTRTHNRLPGT